MESPTGVAFSGGGIRSAAFCSGVLRRLLQRGVTPDYLSCVSGGGYTGTAYLDWKFRHEQRDDPAWHKKFFEHIRSGAIFCDWSRPLVGCFDALVMVLMLVFIAFVAPFIMLAPYAFPISFLVDLFVGPILRAKDRCPNVTATAPTAEPCIKHSGTLGRSELFAILIALAVVSYILSRLFRRVQALMVLLMSASLFSLMFVFLPWFTHDFLEDTPFWMKFLVFFLCAVVWISVPLMREQASMIVFIFLYSYVIYWRVYKSSFLGLFRYSDWLFTLLLLLSGILLWLMPAVVGLQQRVGHLYYRWRLQKAFYTKEGTGGEGFGCGGITTADCFMTIPGYNKLSLDPDRPLTLADLAGMKPEYICNTVVNSWQRNPDDDPYELFTISPVRIERLDCDAGVDELDSLSPRDIRLSEAMATSAAAVSRRMGKYEGEVEVFQDLQNVLGIGMGAEVLSDPRSVELDPILLHVLPFFVGIVNVLPLILFPLLHLVGMPPYMVTIGVFTFLGIMAFECVLSSLPLSEDPGPVRKVARWIILNVAHFRYLRSMLAGVHTGTRAPPIVSLSDGGHLENFGILPLLKMRLKRIVVADGGFKGSDAEYADSLRVALQLARKKLRCSFVGLDGRDVLEDVRTQFVEKPFENQPRSYKFKVQYFEQRSAGVDELVGEGEILLLAPRHPSKGLAPKEGLATWKEALRDVDDDLEAGLWGPGPVMEADEADELTFCCCPCCHCLACKGLSKFICGAFPQDITANQCLTPIQFSAYHREGYRACCEAEAADFLLAQ